MSILEDYKKATQSLLNRFHSNHINLFNQRQLIQVFQYILTHWCRFWTKCSYQFTLLIH